MDVDISEIPNYNAQPEARRTFMAPVDDAHPFDLDSYISGYSGRSAVDRLIHIILTCPSIAPQTFHLAVRQIEALRDPAMYATALSAYEQVASSGEAGAFPPAAEVASLDQKWIEETTKRNLAEKTKLEVELKTYANNMIKESQRVSLSNLTSRIKLTWL